ncbi:hypothetical protein AAG906_038173 [Vitis piasezkii]
MISAFSRKKHLGLMRKMRKECCCFFLLMLLLLSQASSSSADHGSAAAAAAAAPRFGSFRGGSAASELTHVESATSTGNKKDGDAVFGDEKRKIYTGPNPLHNR